MDKNLLYKGAPDANGDEAAIAATLALRHAYALVEIALARKGNIEDAKAFAELDEALWRVEGLAEKFRPIMAAQAKRFWSELEYKSERLPVEKAIAKKKGKKKKESGGEQKYLY